MTTEEKICEKCGKKRRKQLQGSFTQWIFDQDSCSCDSLPRVASSTDTQSQFCENCGRPTTPVRDGSMTQWIFRSVACECGKGGTTQLHVEAEFVEETDDEDALQLDPHTFPVERYKPLVELGSGSSAKVYLCKDRLLNKRVAVKILRTLSNDQFVAFQTEARATSKLVHPNILHLLDFGPTESGKPYMVLEYFDSITLADYLEQNGLFDSYALKQVFMQIAGAMSVAHSMGIYHRDLKPANILIASRDDNSFAVKVIDFGTATLNLLEDAPLVVQGTTLVGTPAYMPPDVALGKSFDKRSEVYSFGCVMFECLTGKLPFEADTLMEVLNLHANVPAPSLSDAGADHSQEIEDLVARCLEKNPDKRFQTMKELQETLAEVDDAEVQFTEPSSSAATSSVPPKTPISIWMLPLISLIAIGVFSFVGYLVLSQADNKPKEKPDMIASKFGALRPRVKSNFTDDQLKQLKGTGLQRLTLDGTNITANGLKYIETEPIDYLSLRELSLDWDEALASVGKMRKLKYLFLSDNKNFAPEALIHLKGLHLNTLSLSSDKLVNDESVGTIAEWFPDLTRLGLSRTSVSGNGLSQLVKLKKLIFLECSGTSFDDSAAESVLSLPIKSIELCDTEISNQGIMRLATMQSLKEIKLLGALNVTPEGVEELKKIRADIRIVIDKPDLRKPF